jgi:uncharacterized protein (TIGR03437 family)
VRRGFSGRSAWYGRKALPSKRIPLFLSLLLASYSNLSGQALFRKPLKVLGDPQFVGTASNPTLYTTNGPNWVEGREFSLPFGVAIDKSVSPPNIYVSDAGNHRVLGFQYGTQLKAGAVADVIIGQVDRFANLSSPQNGRATTGLNLPSGLAVDAAGNLYIADTGNNRIVRYPKPLAQPAGQQFPDLVIGQTSPSGRSGNSGGITATSLLLATNTTTRAGLAFDAAGNLWVADTGNNRVLRYPAASLKANQYGPAADLVLGQNDFTSRVSATIQNSKTGLAAPQGIAFDPSGRLFVSDGAARVVVYAAGVASGGVAIRILGLDPSLQTVGGTTQIAFGSGTPLGVAATSAGVLVADTSNNRIMIFPPVDSWAAESSQPSPAAVSVIGQSSYTVRKANQGNGDASASSLSVPVDIASSGSELFVVDGQNNRVLVFPSSAAGIGGAATRVIGQLDFPYTGVDLLEGREFQIFGTNGASGSAILDQTVTPARLYVADTQNHRILGFKDFTSVKNGQIADIVIGQPDLLRSVVNYPSGDPTTPNDKGLRFPTSLAIDSVGNLYVTDTGNSRVLRFPAPFSSGKTALQGADLVVGQASFNSIVTDPTERTMSAPISLALTADAANASVAASGWLVVSDATHNRVLFFQKPFSNGMSATKVLGSLNFTSIAVQGSSDPPRFSSPRGVAVDPQDRLIVADFGNRRVQIFNKVANINNYDTPPISLNTQFSAPISVSAGANGFWVADQGNNAAVHFPPIDQLPLKNNASDSSTPVVGPLSVFQDSYSNLLVGDSNNRILYFAPQLDLVSAANYSQRPLTAGSITAIFPHSNTGQTTPNVLSLATEAATATPLPTVLADAKVLVNGVAAPLFFVSSGQINAVLPQNLPTGGNADVQVVRPSTGQIYGGAELALASASPALFTGNQAGTGQIIAQNFLDFSLNTAANAVARGQVIIMYGTGLGPVAGAPVDGVAPTGAVPGPALPQVLIGTAKAFVPDANVLYSGLAPGLVGVWQLNVLIPADAQTGGSVAIKVLMNSIPNIDPGNTTATTSIAIK